MLGPRAVQHLQMPHPRDWQGGQMPRSCPGGGGGGWVQVELTDALTHNKREVLLNNFDVPWQGSLTERNKKLSTWVVCYTVKKKILKPFRFSSSQFQYGIVDVSVVQAFLVKRNRKLLAISGYRSMPASTKSLVHIRFCSFSWPVE